MWCISLSRTAEDVERDDSHGAHNDQLPEEQQEIRDFVQNNHSEIRQG